MLMGIGIAAIISTEKRTCIRSDTFPFETRCFSATTFYEGLWCGVWVSDNADLVL